MNMPLAFGWRQPNYSWSSGLDFLGLASPIERILDAWTPGITNATRRARYFSIIPWIHWRYARLGGMGSAADQKRFVRGLETFFGYVNVAAEDHYGRRISGIIRRRFASKGWKRESGGLQIRGHGVPDSPSALDAALYGPSFTRLGLLRSRDGLHACLAAGKELAEVFDRQVKGLPGLTGALEAEAVSRKHVQGWIETANLDVLTANERRLLRALFFAQQPFDKTPTLNRVYSLLLVLWICQRSRRPFVDWDLEVVLASGRHMDGRKVTPPPTLSVVTSRWQVICLLKLLRHAAELAFKGLHESVRSAGFRYPRMTVAVLSLIDDYVKSGGSSKFSGLITRHHREETDPCWSPNTEKPEDYLSAAVDLLAWCFSRLLSDDFGPSLEGGVGGEGAVISADLKTYHRHATELRGLPCSDIARWLLIDRGLARHNRVAAGKLWQHDTFRLVEDEGGVLAIGDCPLPDIGIRTGAMLSLLHDLRLLDYQDGGYVSTQETTSFFKSEVGSGATA